METYLEASRLAKRYGTGDSCVHAVRDASLTAAKGEFVAVMGESGSGKSTFLTMLGGLNTPTGGSYSIAGTDPYALPSERLCDFRRDHLGFVFQSFHLLPFLTLAENVMLPLATLEMSRRERRRRAEEVLDRVGLGGKEKRLPSEVSGGEAERTAIARAIVNRPALVLADEPTGNLDSRTSHEVMGLFAGLAREGVTIVMVTHSRECAAFAGRVLHMADGRT